MADSRGGREGGSLGGEGGRKKIWLTVEGGLGGERKYT